MFIRSKLLALAIASAAATLASAGAVAADAKGSVYGEFRYGLSYSDSNAGAVAAPTGGDYDLDDHRSRLGVRASTSTADVTAFVKYEREIVNDSATGGASGNFDLVREAYLGLKTAFGTMTYGQMATAYQQAGQKLDPFFNTGATSGTSGSVTARNGAGYGLSALTNDTFGAGLIDNHIAYVSPAIVGLSVNAAYFGNEGADGAAGNAEDPDFGGGIEFNNFGITAGVQYLDINSTGGGTNNFSATALPTGAMENTHEAMRVYAGFAASRFGVGVSAERIDIADTSGTAADNDRDYLFASAWVGIVDKVRIAASAGDTNNTPFEGTAWTVGLFCDCMENLTTHVAYRGVDRRASDTNAAQDNDTQAATLGLSYKFDLGFSTAR